MPKSILRLHQAHLSSSLRSHAEPLVRSHAKAPALISRWTSRPLNTSMISVSCSLLRHDFLVSLPHLVLQSLTPLSTSALVTPSLTKHMTTPRLSTFRFRTSSSKKSISSYGNPLALCILEKCCFLSPGKICM